MTPLNAVPLCPFEDHPGYKHSLIDCERYVRNTERGGGVGQWLVSTKQDHLRIFPRWADAFYGDM